MSSLQPFSGDVPLEIVGESNHRLVAHLNKLEISPEAIRMLPVEFIKANAVLPFAIRNGTLLVITAEPGNQRVIDDIRLLSGLEVEEAVAPAPQILEKIAECCQVTVEKMIGMSLVAATTAWLVGVVMGTIMSGASPTNCRAICCAVPKFACALLKSTLRFLPST